MLPDIRWIIAQYGFGPDETHLGVPENARDRLKEMENELVGSSGLVAIYIPEGTENDYNPWGKRGRVVGAARLVDMPPNGKMEDYFYRDLDGSLRWPIGWPCEAVYALEESECPSLREYVEHLFGPGSFRGYVRRFHELGPFRLEPAMREALNRDFAQFEPRR